MAKMMTKRSELKSGALINRPSTLIIQGYLLNLKNCTSLARLYVLTCSFISIIINFGQRQNMGLYHLLGAPIKNSEKREFEENILNRFKDQPETMVVYIDRVLDRQLNKARGLLTFNSILLGILSLLGEEAEFANVGSLIAIISCIPLLVMMYVLWDATDAHSTPQKDFLRGARIAYFRAVLLTVSIVASLVSTIMTSIVITSKL